LIAATFVQPNGVGVSRKRIEDQIVDAALVQMALEPIE
jgi:hypothetical protein